MPRQHTRTRGKTFGKASSAGLLEGKSNISHTVEFLFKDFLVLFQDFSTPFQILAGQKLCILPLFPQSQSSLSLSFPKSSFSIESFVYIQEDRPQKVRNLRAIWIESSLLQTVMGHTLPDNRTRGWPCQPFLCSIRNPFHWGRVYSGLSGIKTARKILVALPNKEISIQA